MKAYIIQQADINALRASILDRSTLLPAIERAGRSVGGISNVLRDEIVLTIERRINLRLSEWELEISK